ncbi:MAG: glycosyltransferase family 39 protein [bacterium]
MAFRFARLNSARGLFFITVALHLAYVFIIFDEELFNHWLPEQYDFRALALISGEQFSNPTAWGSYHILLVPIYKFLQLTGLLNDRLFILTIINSLLAGAATALIYGISQQLFGNKKISVISALLLAVYYPYLYFNALNLSENFIIPLVLGVFFLTIIKLKQRLIFSAIVTGLLFGLSLLARPIIIPFILFFLIWIIWHLKGGRLSVGKYLINFIWPLLLVVMASLLINHSFDAQGRYSLADSGGVNAAIAWCQPRKISYETLQGEAFWFSSPIFQSKDASTDIKSEIPFYNQGHYYQMAFNCLKENPIRIITNIKHPVNIYHSIFYPNYFSSAWHLILINIWKALTIPLFFGFILYPLLDKQNRQFWALGGLLLSSLIIMVYLGNPGEERYLIPYYFVLILWGIPGLIRLFSTFRK